MDSSVDVGIRFVDVPACNPVHQPLMMFVPADPKQIDSVR